MGTEWLSTEHQDDDIERKHSRKGALSQISGGGEILACQYQVSLCLLHAVRNATADRKYTPDNQS